MSRISMFLLCASLLLVGLASIATQGPVRAAYIKLAYEASLQETPQDAGFSLTMLPAGVVVTITGDPVDGYYPITAGGKSGWVRGDALSFDSAVESASAEPVAEIPPTDSATPSEPLQGEPLPIESVDEGPAAVEPVAEDLVLVEEPVEEPAVIQPETGATPVADPALLEPVPVESVVADPAMQDPAGAEMPADVALPAADLDPNAPSVAVPDPGPVGPAAVAVEAAILAGPGPDYGVLGVASPGALVEQTGHAVGGYVTVRYVGVTGWVALDHLGPAPAASSS